MPADWVGSDSVGFRGGWQHSSNAMSQLPVLPIPGSRAG